MSNKEGLELAGISHWAQQWEPRSKLITATLFIFGVISLQTTITVYAAFIITLVGALMMGLSVLFILGRYLLIAPFVLLMTVPLVLGGGFPLDPERISFAALIIGKAITCMTVMTIMLHTQTTDQFMNSLSHLKVPPVIITVLLLSYRYVFLFLDDIQKTQLALKNRYFTSGVSLKGLKTYGQIMGGLLIRSLDRSENVYHAMVSRSFHGAFLFGQSEKIKRSDISKGVLALCILFILLMVENIYFK